MEQFPAGNMSQMEYVKKMLENCDYYILILAGRYGSEDTDGIGFTEKEYDYAISQKIPVMSFVIRDINVLTLSQCEQNKRQQNKLLAFRNKVCNGRLVKFYSNVGELKSHVVISIYQCIRFFPAKGWIRYDDQENIVTEKKVIIKENKNISLTTSSFTDFVDSIDYRAWIHAIKNADNIYSDEHFGGVFFLYSKLIECLQHDNCDYKEFADRLLINKALYNIASQADFYSLCDFLTKIDLEMFSSSCKDIKQYMLKNINVFSDEKGLIKICCEKLNMPKEDKNLGRDFWEYCMKELFELYRMISDFF